MKVSRNLFSCLLALILLLLQSPTPAAADTFIETQCLENNRVCVTARINVNCDGWHWSSSGYTYGEPNITVKMTQHTPIGGDWTDPYTFEIGTTMFRFTVLDKGTGLVDGPYEFIYQFSEPGTCPIAACELEPLYYMYTLRDANQPETWQPFCYVISDQGFPGVERQAQICSVTGFDHTYQATHAPYSGWVSKDCRGNISYGWPDWKSDWFRPEFVKP
jgi:hypothetical protein